MNQSVSEFNHSAPETSEILVSTSPWLRVVMVCHLADIGLIVRFVALAPNLTSWNFTHPYVLDKVLALLLQLGREAVWEYALRSLTL